MKHELRKDVLVCSILMEFICSSSIESDEWCMGYYIDYLSRAILPVSYVVSYFRYSFRYTKYFFFVLLAASIYDKIKVQLWYLP